MAYADTTIVGGGIIDNVFSYSTANGGTLTCGTPAYPVERFTFRSSTAIIQMGAAPGSTAAFNIDASSYGSVPFRTTNTTLNGGINASATVLAFGTASAHNVTFFANNLDKWTILSEAAGTSTLISASAIARIRMGATNGIAFQNSAGSADRYVFNDGGTSVSFSDGTRAFAALASTGSGEGTAGWWLGGNAAASGIAIATNSSGTSGVKGQFLYYNQTSWLSALEVANVASGSGTLTFMLSGGRVAIGTAATTALFTVASTFTATAGAAVAQRLDTTLIAAANADNMRSLRIAPSFTPGAFTGLVTHGMEIAAYSVAGFTSPSTANMITLGILTGKAGMDASGIVIAPPTGGDNNYLIRHTTAATFNVSAAGAITAAGAVTIANGISTTGSNDITSGRSLILASTGTVSTVARGKISFPADGQQNMLNNAESAGVGFDYATDAVLKLRTRAQSAYATFDALAYRVGGVAGVDFGPGLPTSLTIVKGIVTAAS